MPYHRRSARPAGARSQEWAARGGKRHAVCKSAGRLCIQEGCDRCAEGAGGAGDGQGGRTGGWPAGRGGRTRAGDRPGGRAGPGPQRNNGVHARICLAEGARWRDNSVRARHCLARRNTHGVRYVRMTAPHGARCARPYRARPSRWERMRRAFAHTSSSELRFRFPTTRRSTARSSSTSSSSAMIATARRALRATYAS